LAWLLNYSPYEDPPPSALGIPNLCSGLFPSTSCKKNNPAAPDQPNVVRIEAIKESAEQLIPGESLLFHTEQSDALGKAIDGMTARHETDKLPLWTLSLPDT
jgi:hypothetical protein